MKRKAVSLVLCVVMILSAMTFSVSADVGKAQTLLKDDFSNWYTVKDEKLFSPTIEKICGIETITPPAALKKKLSTPIDLDSENVYYASWVQSLDDISKGSNSYLKSGFVNFTAEATSENLDGRSELIWIGNDSDIPTTKVALQKSLSNVAYKDNMVNTGTLYNVLMKIEAHKSEQDKISVKIWPADCAEPLDWSGEKAENATGERAYFGVVTYSAAHFGNLNVEVYSGDKASAADKLIADAKAYAAGNAEKPSIDENSDIIANGVVYNSAKNIISLKTNTYVREIALAKITGSGSDTKYTRASKVTAGSKYSVVVKIANDSGAEISGKEYFAAVASYNSAGEMQRVKFCIVNSKDAKENGGLAKTSGLAFDDEITADEANGKIRVYVWDAQTLEPITNGVTIDGNKIINY